MSHLQVFAVYDKSACTFGTPFFMPSAGVAIRAFSDEVNRSDESNLLFRHPADFALFLLGVFETDSGSFDVPAQSTLLLQGIDAAISQNAALSAS